MHTGENVRFDFVLQDWRHRLVQPLAIADYCVVMIGQERIETEPDIHGHFGFSHTFDNLSPGDAQVVTVTAYQQRAGRDWMKISGQWLHSDSPYEQADRKVTSDSIVLEAYQSAIKLSIARPSYDLDVETGVLNIRRTDGPTTAVYVDRPARKGYVLTGPDASGQYHLSYQPRAAQLNPTGTTDVEFTIRDKSGRPHRQSISLNTP